MDYKDCNCGTAYIDCNELDLTETDEQTIIGLYKRCNRVIGLGKNLYAVNCKWGTLDVTPIPVFGIKFDNGDIIFTASTLQVSVNANDVVTITNMLAD